MSEKEDLVAVVDGAALIENILNQAIEEFCAPAKNRFQFFWDVILDSSILPMGSKAKVAMAISQTLKYKLDQESIHKVMSLRNAFAHHKTQSHPVMVVGKTSDQNSSHFELQVISNSGNISRQKREDALAEFKKVSAAAKKSLVGLLDLIKSSNDADS